MDDMIKRILEAAEILELGEKASLVDINRKYKNLLFKWHPDRCRNNMSECRAMTEKVIEAYRVLTEYCCSQSFSFKEEDISCLDDSDIDPDEFWQRKFGHDPHWGYPGHERGK